MPRRRQPRQHTCDAAWLKVESQYRLRLMAYDGGEPSRSASVDIIVSVTDSNDNRPRFTSDEYSASVVENAARGTVVVQVMTRRCFNVR